MRSRARLLAFSLVFIMIVGLFLPFVNAVDIATTTNNQATNYPFQRKCFYANGYYYVFFSDGTNLCYYSSTDKISWSAKVAVYPSIQGQYASVWYQEGTNYTHFAYGAATSLKYWRGTCQSNGTLTWDVVRTVSGVTAAYPFISVDSGGYPWIGYWYNNYPYVVKSTTNDGTWATAAGFPYKLSATSSSTWKISPIPMDDLKVLVIYGQDDDEPRAQCWDGDSWLAEVKPSLDHLDFGYTYTATAEGDTVHLGYYDRLTDHLLYTLYTYATNTFSAPITMRTDPGTSTPILAWDNFNSDLYYMWMNTTLSDPQYLVLDNGVWNNTVNTIVDDNGYSGAMNGYYAAYDGHIGVEYLTNAGAPNLYIVFEEIGVNTVWGSHTFSIENYNADDWLFAEYKYYTFNLTYSHPVDWSYIEEMAISFNDEDGPIEINYDLSSGLLTAPQGDTKIALRYISAENVSLTDYELVFGVYLTKNIFDTLNVDVDINVDNSDVDYLATEPNLFNIYNLGGLTEYLERGDADLSNHPTKGDPFDIECIDGAGGDIEVNVTYRNLQHVKLLSQIIIPEGLIDSAYAGEWSAEYGFYYYVNGYWTKGYNLKLELSNGFLSSKDFWIFLHARWFRNDGIQVGNSEYFSSFFRPGYINGTTIFVDLWFSNTNYSKTGAGRVSAEYYGMQDSTDWWAFWYSDWGPLLSNQTMSYYEWPLVDKDGDLISTRDIELVKIYSRVYKTASTGNYTIEVKAPDLYDRQIAKGDFIGIQTPPFIPPKIWDMPQGGLFGLLAALMASLTAALVAALTPAFSTVIGMLDGIFMWAGWPGGFTMITTWISAFAGFMISSMAWAYDLLVGLFSFLTVGVPKIVFFFTNAFSIWVNMINTLFGLFSGAYGTVINIWVDFNGESWLTLALLAYPIYLAQLFLTKGIGGIMPHIDLIRGILTGIIDLALTLASFVWNFVQGLIENIPVVE